MPEDPPEDEESDNMPEDAPDDAPDPLAVLLSSPSEGRPFELPHAPTNGVTASPEA
jgi:hypothetical protein